MIIDALVEIPKGSRNKFEYDEASGRLRLNRVLYSPLHYPADYGFLPGTLAEDGDHLDVLIVTYDPTFPGCLVPVRPVGVLDMHARPGGDQALLRGVQGAGGEGHRDRGVVGRRGGRTDGARGAAALPDRPRAIGGAAVSKVRVRVEYCNQ